MRENEVRLLPNTVYKVDQPPECKSWGGGMCRMARGRILGTRPGRSRYHFYSHSTGREKSALTVRRRQGHWEAGKRAPAVPPGGGENDLDEQLAISVTRRLPYIRSSLLSPTVARLAKK